MYHVELLSDGDWRPPRSSRARLQARRLPGAGLGIDTGNDIRGKGTTSVLAKTQDRNGTGSLL